MNTINTRSLTLQFCGYWNVDSDYYHVKTVYCISHICMVSLHCEYENDI